MERWKAKRLIVNADDLALHAAVNRAVFRTHREGIVSSATILVGGSAFLEAVEKLPDHPRLGIGVHLCLVDQKPVCKPDEIPSLVEEDGRLQKSYAVFTKKYFLRRISIEEVRREWRAQLSRAADVGLKITHLDSHQHLHVLPRLLPVAADLARHFGVEFIRLPADDPALGIRAPSGVRRAQGAFLAGLADRARRKLQQWGLRSSDAFFGFACGGNLGRDHWLRLIPKLREGVTEIMVHPGDDDVTLRIATGWDYHWEAEAAALTDREVCALLERHEVQLVHYGELS